MAVVYGGRSSEHGISVVSAGSVMAALDPAKYEVVPVGITPAGGWVLTAGDPAAMQITGRTVPSVAEGAAVVAAGRPDREGAGHRRAGQRRAALETVDVVFPVLHGRFGEDGTIQGLLEMAGVPYVGPGVFASAAAMDKEYTKKLLAAEGLRGRPVRGGPPPATACARSMLAHLGLPAFVKPARAGSSVGHHEGHRLGRAARRARDRLRARHKVLVEAAVSGREIECGVLEGADGSPEAIRAGRDPADAAAHDWYDFEAKYLDDACEFDIPAQPAAPTSPRACRRRPAGRSSRSTAPGWPASTSSSRADDAGGRQRGEHDARLHADLDVPADVGGDRRRRTPSWSTG